MSKNIIQTSGVKTLPFCDSYALMKCTAAPINRQLQPRSSIPFSHMGLDFWETRKTSLQGHNYVFGATCYATSFAFFIFLKSRSSASDCLSRLNGLAKSYGFQLRTLKLDNDSCFHSHDFTSSMDNFGIRLEFTSPNSHHQNGLQERSWGTLSRWTLC